MSRILFAFLLVLLISNTVEAAAPDTRCRGEDADFAVLARQQFSLGPNEFVALILQKRLKDMGPLENASAPGVVFYAPGPATVLVFDPVGYPCKSLIEIPLKDYETARVSAIDLSWFKGVDVVGEMIGGSGSSTAHIFLSYSSGKFIRANDEPISFSNQGGGYIGSLPDGDGVGLIIWDAQFRSGSHFDPLFFDVTRYHWDGSAFQSATKQVLPARDARTKELMLKSMHLPRSGLLTDEGFPYSARLPAPAEGKVAP